MMNISALLHCVQPNLLNTNVRCMSRIAQAMLSMTGWVTMLGLSCWVRKGASRRTVQQFFNTVIPHLSILVQIEQKL